jgi:hypothetical protein
MEDSSTKMEHNQLVAIFFTSALVSNQATTLFASRVCSLTFAICPLPFAVLPIPTHNRMLNKI